MVHHRRTCSMAVGVEELTLRLSATKWTAEEADLLLDVLAYVLEQSCRRKEAGDDLTVFRREEKPCAPLMH